MKQCKECLMEKDLEPFYSHPGTKDRRTSRCKECIKSGRKSERERSMARVIDNKRYKTESWIKKLSSNTKKFREKYPEKRKAEQMVSNIIRKKDIRYVRPKYSFVSGATWRIHLHHFDYSKPFEVIPCTPLEHAAFHKWTLEVKEEYIWKIPF